MDYFSKYHELKPQFDLSSGGADFRGCEMKYRTFTFTSSASLPFNPGRPARTDGYFSLPDEMISENQTFTYPVFLPGETTGNRRCILLLHGLNERSWTKYLAWAYYLAEHTGHPVILFPIAFHMNRSPQSWSDPRQMAGILGKRTEQAGKVSMATFANIALSERLIEDPLRFLVSGNQSACDIQELIRTIRQGRHPCFSKGTVVDVFSYSIGAFLAQILFIGDFENLFRDSKLFIFCGGSFFDRMDGVSKLIMDAQAFRRLRQYYLSEINTEKRHTLDFGRFLKFNPMGMSFNAMLASCNMKSFRKARLNKLKEQIRVVVLRNDMVIPAAGAVEVFGNIVPVEILDLPYPYTHENPFPVNINGMQDLVNKGFNQVFTSAAAFLA